MKRLRILKKNEWRLIPIAKDAQFDMPMKRKRRGDKRREGERETERQRET